ncbi:MAG: helix-turn-helix domain-containing protein [Kangiellaceae bacterium]|nr:helix-turn-helix domain-containing protein [Kangiellaceae bacterium]
MPQNIIQHFYTVGSASSMLMAILVAVVLFRSGCSHQTRIGFIFLALALSTLTNSLLHDLKIRFELPVLVVPDPFQLLIGPLFYLYLLKKNERVIERLTLIAYTLPFVLASVFLAWFVANLDSKVMRSPTAQYLSSGLSFVIYLQIGIYYFICHKQIKRLEQQLKDSCSNIDRINQNWVEQILLILVIGYSGITLLYLSNHAAIYLPVNKSITVILAGITYLMVYRTFRRPEIFTDIKISIEPKPEVEEHSNSKEKNKYQKSGLTSNQVGVIYIRVQNYMVKHKPFIEPELSLGSLARRLQLSNHHLSQVINHKQEVNFYDFINSYRIDEVKQQLIAQQNIGRPILTIALEAGFNSKATFNRIFKERVQTTPSQYRKENR